MPKVIEENERMKRKYLDFLKQAEGKDEKTLDKVAAALRQFEESNGVKPFKRFHIEQAGRFKAFLEKARNNRTGKPLSLSTIDATLAQVKAFFKWLAGQQGYKSRIGYSDANYFNNTLKNKRAAHAKRAIPYPSMEQALHAFTSMPERDQFELRDKAVFAFFMLTGGRISAVASLRLKHIDLVEGYVFQDGRNVNTKAAKTIDTWFFPVEPEYRECLERWIKTMRENLLFGPEDALFPTIEIGNKNGSFAKLGLTREPYGSSAKLNQIVRQAFETASLPPFTPHCFRKTLAKYGDEICGSMEELKAWSMNLGHDNLSTTVNSYMPVSRQRQKEIIQRMRDAGKQ